MKDIISSINIDMIMSDPMLLVGVILFCLGPLFFLVALWKFITSKKKLDFEIPREPELENPEATSPSMSTSQVSPPPAPAIEETPDLTPVAPVPPPVRTPPPPPHLERAEDKTVVIQPGISEFQGQLEFVFNQLKTLNRTVSQLEDRVESIGNSPAPGAIDINQLKTPPMNPGEFTQKLLKLAEHVIQLEKEVARLKGVGLSGTAPAAPMQAPAPNPSKPPVMPI